MRTKHWLPLFSSFIAASIVAGCGSDSSSPPIGTAGSHSGGAGGAHAGAGGASGGSSGAAHAGGTNGGAANGGASAGAGSTAGESGSAGAEEGGSAGTGGAAAGAGGAHAGAGGATAGAGGAAAGAGGATAGAGGAAAGAGGAAAGAGGTTAGAGGTSGAAGSGGTAGSGGAPGANLCDKNLWKYTFQFCPRTDNSGANQPTKAVDDDVATFVTSGKAQDGTFYALLDLHGAVNVTSFVIDHGGGGANEGDASLMPVVLQASDNGTDFANIVGATTSPITNHKFTVTVPGGVTHRYLKLLQQGAGGNWWAVPEINLTCSGNGTAIAPPPDAVTPRANWKILTPNSVCGDDNRALVASMLDNNATTTWQSIGKPGVNYWIRVDLGTPTALTNVDITHKTGDFPPTMKLQTSVDDITYVDVKTGIAGAVDTKIVFDAPVTTRFFRIVSTADTAGAWWSISELDINVP